MELNIDYRLDFQKLNETIRAASDHEVVINGCMGQRYIASGLSDKEIMIHGTPGNALGSYLNGAKVQVYGNAQDAVGDTMNEGEIIVHGSCGDAVGYAMRGGRILIHGNAGYRAGIHMKAYKDKVPVLVVGGKVGSFLGEYQAGGRIIVLNLGTEEESPVGFFCGTGMHGGKIFLRTRNLPDNLSSHIVTALATEEDLKEIEPELAEFCSLFGENLQKILEHPFYVLTPDSQNPYKQLYTHN